MTGNSQFGGTCFDVVNIPDLQYYPRYMTISYYLNSVLDKPIYAKVKIRDCDFSDDDWQDYYVQGLNSGSFSFSQNDLDLSNLKLLTFDLQGRQIAFDITNNVMAFDDKNPKIIILTYWNAFNVLVKTEKVLIQ